jgi:thiol-disulfide isomerase/thioredoxin
MRKVFLLSIIFCSVLVSCNAKGLPYEKRIPLANYSYDEPSDYNNIDYKDYTTSISSNELVNKINNDESFVVYFYSEGCHYCHEVKPLFIRYICEKDFVINTLEVNSESESYAYIKDTLCTNFPTVFEDIYTPYFYFFLEGEKVAQKGLTQEQRKDYRLFKEFLDGYVKPLETN